MFDLDDDIHDKGRGEARASDGARYGRPVEMGRLLRALFRRRRWIIFGMALSAVLGAVVAKTLVPRVYEAETVMVWEAVEETAAPNVRELRTLVDSVKLPTNVAIIRRDLAVPATLDQLASRLDVQFDPDSNLVIVRAEADSGEGAVTLSEKAVEVFLDHQRGIARERLEEDVEQAQTDADRARGRLNRAQESYDAFRREHGVSDLSFERQQAIELAAGLRAQADIARADSQAAEERGDLPPPTMRTPGESPQLRQIRRQLETARSRLSEDHPRVMALAAEVAAVQQTEAAEAAGSEVGAGNRSARNRAAALRRQQALERMEGDARARLAELSSVEGEASALLASVRVAEGVVADVETQLAEAQDAMDNASPGFRVVGAPLLPELPARSYRRPVAIGLPIALVVVMLLVLLGLELRGLRVKTANELAYWARAPVVASTTWPGKARELAAVVEELAEAATKAGGRTLVVSASQLDQSIADDVAEHLRVTVSVGGGGGADEDKAFYDPKQGLVTPPPTSDRVLVTDSPTGTDIMVSSDGVIDIAGGDGTAEPAMARGPALARREEKTIARRRGGRLEQVKVERARIYMDDPDEPKPVEIVTHEGAEGDAFVRRSARAADRVLVVVRSGALSMAKASELRALVGRQDDGVGLLLVAVPDWLSVLADRAGPVSAFWRNRTAE